METIYLARVDSIYPSPQFARLRRAFDASQYVLLSSSDLLRPVNRDAVIVARDARSAARIVAENKLGIWR